jgi:hypothetical protein
MPAMAPILERSDLNQARFDADHAPHAASWLQCRL